MALDGMTCDQMLMKSLSKKLRREERGCFCFLLSSLICTFPSYLHRRLWCLFVFLPSFLSWTTTTDSSFCSHLCHVCIYWQKRSMELESQVYQSVSIFVANDCQCVWWYDCFSCRHQENHAVSNFSSEWSPRVLLSLCLHSCYMSNIFFSTSSPAVSCEGEQ